MFIGSKENWGYPADLSTNQTVLDPKVHCHTSRTQQVGIEPTSPPMKVVALPTKPHIPLNTSISSKFRYMSSWTQSRLEIREENRPLSTSLCFCNWPQGVSWPRASNVSYLVHSQAGSSEGAAVRTWFLCVHLRA